LPKPHEPTTAQSFVKELAKPTKKEKEILKNAQPHDKKTNESKQNRTYKPRQTEKHWW
jgi:hypothetical protein